MARSRPRARPDFRFRTPPNANVIQVPGVGFGLVSCISAVLTGAQQVTFLFDAPLETAGDVNWITVTAQDPHPFSEYFDGGLDSQHPSNVVWTHNVNGTGVSRAVCDFADFADPIDVALQGWFFNDTNFGNTRWINRLLNVRQSGQIAVP
jgi:hypothetical protein